MKYRMTQKKLCIARTSITFYKNNLSFLLFRFTKQSSSSERVENFNFVMPWTNEQKTVIVEAFLSAEFYQCGSFEFQRTVSVSYNFCLQFYRQMGRHISNLEILTVNGTLDDRNHQRYQKTLMQSEPLVLQPRKICASTKSKAGNETRICAEIFDRRSTLP